MNIIITHHARKRLNQRVKNWNKGMVGKAYYRGVSIRQIQDVYIQEKLEKMLDKEEKYLRIYGSWIFIFENNTKLNKCYLLTVLFLPKEFIGKVAA